jgi:hypothetical protein
MDVGDDATASIAGGDAYLLPLPGIWKNVEIEKEETYQVLIPKIKQEVTERTNRML